MISGLPDNLLSGDAACLLLRFLNRESNLALFLLDGSGVILHSNGGIQRLLGNDKLLKGLSVKNVLAPESRQVFEAMIGELNRKDSSRTDCPFVHKTLQFQSDASAIYSMSSFMASCGTGWFMICENRRMTESNAIGVMTNLNNQLAQMSRELTTKNIELEKANARITLLMNIDPLTGLANRRFFEEKLTLYTAESDGNLKPLSCIMLDIDNFKTVNDTHGHACGDEVLAALGELISIQTRERDIAARYGGEEFVVLLRDTDISEAGQYARRLLESVRDTKIHCLDSNVTISSGVAGMRPGEEGKHMLKRADDALYRAKRAGRNRVVVATTDYSGENR